jgi:hypothetical protein
MTGWPDQPVICEINTAVLLAAIDDHQVRTGAWRLLEASGWPDNQSCAMLALQ